MIEKTNECSMHLSYASTPISLDYKKLTFFSYKNTEHSTLNTQSAWGRSEQPNPGYAGSQKVDE